MDAPEQVDMWGPGTAVGSYRLVRPLARGGMGEVWLARQSGIAGFERLVAIKRIIAGGEGDTTLQTMFLDEARIAAQLHHANIVQVFELGQLGESYYLVMEYLRGQSLARVARRLIEQQGRVPIDVAVQIVSEAARGLGHAHRKLGPDGKPLGIVHRDVSPQNLFVSYDGQVKVLDFGIAKAAGRITKTQTGIMRGRLAYMSPEQAMGVPVSPASDVFSLGVILYELLSGARLYGQADDIAIFRSLAERTVPLPITDYPGVDAGLGAVVMSALHPDDHQRPHDGSTLADALLSWQRSHAHAGAQSLEQVMREAFSREIAQAHELENAPLNAPAPATTTPSKERRRDAISSGSNSLPDLGVPKPRSSSRGVVAAGIGAVALLLLGAGVFVFGGKGEPPQPVPAPTVPTPAPVAVAPPPTPPPSVPEPAPTPVPAPIAPTPTPVPVAPPVPVAAATPRPTPKPALPKPAGAKPDAKPEPAPSGKGGTLSLDTEPWSQVFLGKKLLGETPLLDVPVPAGRHVLRLVNGEHNIDTTIEVTITAEKRTVKRLAL